MSSSSPPRTSTSPLPSWEGGNSSQNRGNRRQRYPGPRRSPSATKSPPLLCSSRRRWEGPVLRCGSSPSVVSESSSSSSFERSVQCKAGGKRRRTSHTTTESLPSLSSHSPYTGHTMGISTCHSAPSSVTGVVRSTRGVRRRSIHSIGRETSSSPSVLRVLLCHRRRTLQSHQRDTQPPPARS